MGVFEAGAESFVSKRSSGVEMEHLLFCGVGAVRFLFGISEAILTTVLSVARGKIGKRKIWMSRLEKL